MAENQLDKQSNLSSSPSSLTSHSELVAQTSNQVEFVSTNDHHLHTSPIPINCDVGFKEIAEISPIEGNGGQTTGDYSKGRQERGVKKEKRVRKSSKNGHVKMVKKETGIETAFDKKRKEMEELRFVDVEKQNKMWAEVYCGLGSVVSKEYDALLPANDPNPVHFDPRQQFLKKKPSSNMGEKSEKVSHFDPDGGLTGNGVDGDSGVLEDCCEDDDSDPDYPSIQKPAFMVTGEPNFDSGPPQDGLEYLRRVRWEAEQIPRVKVVKVEKSKLNKEQTVYMPNIPDIAVCPENLMPSKQWEDAFLRDFSELRLALSQQSVPVVLEEECSQHLLDSIILEKVDNLTSNSCELDGKATDSLSNMEEGGASDPAASKEDSVEWPTLTTISAMDSVTRVSTLKKRVKIVETMSSVSRNECAWLFALCAAVDAPLDGDTSASLRSLLRKCASLRAEKSELDDQVIMLNILATISGKYFQQSEI